MEILAIALASAAIILCLFLFVALSWLNKKVNEERDVNDRRDENYRTAHMQERSDLNEHSERIDERIDRLTEKEAAMASRTDELERRLHCVEEDLEKIPVEEVNAEVQRLELFNDGIANIMGYGPDVPKLNKEVLKHE